MDSPTVHKRPLLDDIPSQNGDGTDHRYKQAQVTLPPLESFAPRPPQSNGIFQLPHPGPLHTSVSFPPMDSQEIDRLLPGSGTSNGRGPELPPIAQFASSGPSQALLTGQSMQPTQGFQPPHSLHMNPLQSINSLQSTQTSTTARSSSSQSRNPMSVAALINGSPSCSRPESSAFKPTSQPPPLSSSDVQPARLSSPSPELVAPIPVSLVPRDKPQANGTPRMPQVIVENDPSLNMGDIEERRLGYIVYNPKEILPPLEGNLNGILEVWISSNHLTWDNEKVKKRWIWGTEIYTDDTDVVAALIHTNRFTPLVPKSQLQAALPSDTLWNSTRPNYDLCVTVRVCRKLVQYRGALRNSLRSRSWGNHHGVSFMIESVRRMNEGEAIGRARGRGRKERLRRFHRMKKRVFEEQPKLMYKNHPARETVVVAFNREGDPCLKYTKSLLTDTDWLEKRLQKKVAILENDYERYELSFDRERGRYRFAVVSPAVHLGRRVPLETTGDSSTVNALTFPLGDAHIEEVISDDLGLENFEWNVVGVIVRVPGEEARSMLVVVKLLYLRDRVQQE